MCNEHGEHYDDDTHMEHHFTYGMDERLEDHEPLGLVAIWCGRMSAMLGVDDL